MGFSLAETRRFFDLYDADRSSVQQLHTMLSLIDEKKEHLQQQMEDITVVLMELSSVETRCQSELKDLIK